MQIANRPIESALIGSHSSTTIAAMKLQFSLATLLVCMTVLAVVVLLRCTVTIRL